MKKILKYIVLLLILLPPFLLLGSLPEMNPLRESYFQFMLISSVILLSVLTLHLVFNKNLQDEAKIIYFLGFWSILPLAGIIYWYKNIWSENLQVV
jgi:hypothetical protein